VGHGNECVRKRVLYEARLHKTLRCLTRAPRLAAPLCCSGAPADQERAAPCASPFAMAISCARWMSSPHDSATAHGDDARSARRPRGTRMRAAEERGRAVPRRRGCMLLSARCRRGVARGRPARRVGPDQPSVTGGQPPSARAGMLARTGCVQLARARRLRATFDAASAPPERRARLPRRRLDPQHRPGRVAGRQ